MKDLTEGHEGKLIFQFAAPMLLGNIFQQLFNIVDSVVVGNFVGKQALAAIGASFPVLFVMVSMIIGLVIGTTIVISQYFGAKNFVMVKRAIDTMFVYTFFASLIITVAGYLLSEPILRMMGLPEEVMPQAVTYLRISFLGIIIMFGYNGTAAALRGLGDSKTPLYFLIIATFANIVLDLLFVALFGWGVAGAAFATLSAYGLAFILSVIWLNRNHKLIRVAIRGLHFDREVLRQSLRIGLPTGIQQTLVALGGLALMSIVNSFGTNVIAAFSVASRLEAMATIPAMSFSAAISTFVGQNIGANKFDRIRTGLRATLKMMGGITIITTILLILAGNFLMTLFTKDAEIIRLGNQYLTIVAIFYIMFTLMFIYSGVMRGAGDTLIPMFISLLSLWIIRIPFAWYFSGQIGVTGIWWSIPAGWFIGLSLSWIYYKSGRWKTKSVVKFSGN